MIYASIFIKNSCNYTKNILLKGYENGYTKSQFSINIQVTKRIAVTNLKSLDGKDNPMPVQVRSWAFFFANASENK